MPRITEAEVERETDDGVCGPVEMLRFSDTGRLTQFGAHVEILPPGSRSSIRHWHAAEDEMVYVLDGTVVLQEGAAEVTLRPGDAATFRAGDPVGHCLENRGAAPARYLVIGTRASRDMVTYPDHDRVLASDRESGLHAWTDGAGRPATSPYQS
jgi:uncharacterized cupin superfamily protein